MMEQFNEDYYERGVETGTSCYSNYRWMPELTIPLAYHLVRHLGIRDSDTVLDYGCAKGYLVKALRLLGFIAWGCDVSEYALSHSPEDIRCFLFRAANIRVEKYFTNSSKFDWVISKDVLEHIGQDQLPGVLSDLREATQRLLVVVPLGNGTKYEIPAYELDKTHLIRESIGWWSHQLESSGFHVTSATYSMPGVKANWAQFPRGNGFIIAR